MNVICIESKSRNDLYPLNLAKPNACLRMGMFTFQERWEQCLNNATFSYLTEPYLQQKYPMKEESENLFLNPLFLPEELVLKAVQTLRNGEALFYEDVLLAFKGEKQAFENGNYKSISQLEGNFIYIKHPWDFFTYNQQFLQFDYDLKDKDNGLEIPSWVRVAGGEDKIYIHPTAKLENCILNTSSGFIFIEKGATIQDGAMIRGNTYIGENSTVRMGAKIYENTSIGPQCKVGGEISNCILQQNSNKAHDGYLGNSVIGEWCNLGADTNNSNLKNTYSNVDVWSVDENKYISTGLQFCGLMMGDHSKSAINTQFNTGTIVGFSAQIFQNGFPPKHIISFSFGGKRSGPKVKLSSAEETATKVMKRRGVEFSKEDKEIFQYLYDNS